MCDVCLHSGTCKSGAWGELVLEVDLGSMSTCGFINTGRRKRCGLRTSAGGLESTLIRDGRKSVGRRRAPSRLGARGWVRSGERMRK